MRIAVASEGKGPESRVSGMAGRAPYYIIFDGEGRLLEVIRNPFASGGAGAGWGVAKTLADKGANRVIAGRLGPNFIQALEQRGIGHMEASGKADEAARKAYKAGEGNK